MLNLLRFLQQVLRLIVFAPVDESGAYSVEIALSGCMSVENSTLSVQVQHYFNREDFRRWLP
jgi:hypothetical protein